MMKSQCTLVSKDSYTSSFPISLYLQSNQKTQKLYFPYNFYTLFITYCTLLYGPYCSLLFKRILRDKMMLEETLPKCYVFMSSQLSTFIIRQVPGSRVETYGPQLTASPKPRILSHTHSFTLTFAVMGIFMSALLSEVASNVRSRM